MRLIVTTFILVAILSCSLLGIIWCSSAQIEYKLFATIIILMLLIICTAFMLLLSRQVNTTLEALSQTIQFIIDDRPRNTFSEMEDTILSKLQSQIIRLSDILKSYNLRQKEEKESITSLISDISHQLKTPLANLNMYNSLLLDNHLNDDKRFEFMQNIQNQLHKLNWLMESLIKMSRLEAGIISLNKEYVSLSQTVLQSINMVSLKAEYRNIDITFVADDDISLEHDVKWTQEAIFNILDNAVKYSPPDTVITINLIKYELFCRIDIADNGCGITEADINKIFARFYRGANVKDCEGVGIGLYISRKIITEQGGYIKVKSAIGKGTLFSVFLSLG